MIQIGIFIVLFMASIGQLAADEIHLLVNGRSIHLDSNENLNEDNRGLGIEYDFDKRGNWINLINFSSFKDSKNETSNYLGAGTKLRAETSGPDPWHFDIGAFAFIMTRKDYKNNQPFIGILPLLSFGSELVGINMTYIPAFSENQTDLIYFQAMIRFSEY